MENSSVIQIGHFKQVLDNTSVPFAGKVRESLLAFLTADSRRVARAFRDQESEGLAKKEAEAEHIQLQADANQERLNQSEREVQSAQRGSSVLGLVSLICFVLCFAAEYVFNNAVMPWLVSVPPKALLGIALSLAPATAPVILDRVIVALFDIDDSWEAVKGALTPLNRFARCAVRIAFMLAVGGLNLYSIWLLADARGIASFLRNSDGATTISMLQQGKVDLALLMVSIAVTIDGALFYLFGLHEMRAAHQLRLANRRLAALRSTQCTLDASRSAAAAELASSRRRWDDIDNLQQSVADAYFAEGMVMLEEKESSAQPARELALRILGRPSALAAMPAMERKALTS